MLKKIVFCFLLVIRSTVSIQAQDTTQQIIADRINKSKQEKKPYVILISADGFRYDCVDRFNATNLKKLRAQGVEAAFMKPCYPSVTFPNHYAIITGMYPSHNGLVDNDFYDENGKGFYSMGKKTQVADSSWYGGKPLWVLAEEQKMLSASFYWVASEAAIDGVKPTYYYNYNTEIGIDDRINEVKKWLQLPEEKRPHFITFYFPEVDHEEHTHGVNSKEAEAAVHFVDESVGKMSAMVDSLHMPVNFVFLSDHGMVDVDTNGMKLPKAIDTTKFYVPMNDLLLHLYAKDKTDVMPTYLKLKAEAKDYDVYLEKDIPSRWHYAKKDDTYNRIGDILLVPHFPKVFNLGTKKTNPGKHGYDNDMAEMHATFYAWGPAFKEHLKIDGFENINVYPAIAKILGLQFKASSIDGKLSVLKPILK